MAENDTSKVLTTKQETVIACLLSGHTVQTAAKAANVSERTVRRWQTLPHFQASLKAAHQQVFDRALLSLMLKVEAAIETLDRNMSGELVPASVQVRSAQIILEQAVSLHKVSSLEAEIEELRRLVGNDDLA